MHITIIKIKNHQKIFPLSLSLSIYIYMLLYNRDVKMFSRTFFLIKKKNLYPFDAFLLFLKFLKKKKNLYPNYFLVIDIYEYMTLEFEFMKQIEYKFLNPKGMQVFLNAPKQP